MLQSAPPRGPRGGTSSGGRGRGRGGIQKRRADGPARVDRDGDLVMDPAAGAKRRAGKGRMEPSSRAGGTGRTNGTTRGGLVTNKAKAAILRGIDQANVLESRITTGTSLEVEGLSSSKASSNPDGGVESLLGFLERKASGLDAKSNRAVKIKKSLKKGDKIIITASPSDIVELQKLDGFTFAGTVLSIKPCEPNSGRVSDKRKEEAPETSAVKEKFKEVLYARYNTDLKLLNLSALATDPGLISMGMFDGNTDTSKVFPALLAVCDGLFTSRTQKKEAIVSVTLADNGLFSVSEVNALASTFPDIKNIDLSRNNLTGMKSLDAWRYKFKLLENLVLIGNPIEAQLAELKDELLKRYSYLAILNNVQVRSPEELAALKAAATAAKSPLPLAAPLFVDAGGVGENFVRQFLGLYDTNQSALLSTFYDSQSTYSLSINMNAPRNHTDGKLIPPWAAYVKYSRNMTRITHAPARVNRLHKGVDAIKSVWSSLPASRHPDLVTEVQKYAIECMPTSGLPDPTNQSPAGVDGLIITIHGEFEEPNTAEKGSRSFSRTFILGPGAPGIQPIRVITDTLVLRAHSPLAQPHQQPMVATPQQKMVQPAMVPTSPQQPAQMAMTQQQKQEAITLQLMEKTGMTVQYAGMCLTETGWNLEAAFAAFIANKDKLPVEAFLANVPQ